MALAESRRSASAWAGVLFRVAPNVSRDNNVPAASFGNPAPPESPTPHQHDKKRNLRLDKGAPPPPTTTATTTTTSSGKKQRVAYRPSLVRPDLHLKTVTIGRRCCSSAAVFVVMYYNTHVQPTGELSFSSAATRCNTNRAFFGRF